MTSRILPVEEWSRLSGCEMGAVWQTLRPSEAQILVVEHEGAIVAHWALIRVYHVEGLWIRPDHQKRTSVARRLWAGMRALVSQAGARSVMTAADTTDVRALLEKVGAVKFPFDSYVMPMPEVRCQP